MSTEPPSVASILAQQPGQSQHASGFDNLTCQWQGCGERSTSPEKLYEHVCDQHVGRKSTNNLNLQCQWGSCRTTTVKRDHITSHIRVHVPLKPHKCEFCGKSFKRPQDLKKHVKTHADDSVLNRTPDGTQGAIQRGQMPSYPQNGGRGMNDGNMYNAAPQPIPQPGYQYPAGTAAQAPMGGGQGGNYGPIYYNIPNTGYSGLALTEQRKRQHDTLDAFFGDVKRRQLEPTQYFDLGSQFGGMQSMPMITDGGYGGGYSVGNQNNEFAGSGGGAEGGVGIAPMAVPQSQQFDPTTFSNLKTKNDLLCIDRFLEQLQRTVYERSATIAVENAGRAIAQQTANTGNLDPELVPARGSPGQYSMPTDESSATTPGLANDSEMSTRSPRSVHSFQSNLNTTTQYPSLPSASAMTNPYAGDMMQQHPSSVPPGGLGSTYEDDRTRRYSGDNLQRARSTSSRSPQNNRSHGNDDKESIEKGMKKTALSSPTEAAPPTSIEPPTKGGQNESIEGMSNHEEHMERWVNNMRTIETLRRYLHGRLQQGEFEDLGSPSSGIKEENGDTTPKANSPKDYPMEELKSVAYPALRAA